MHNCFGFFLSTGFLREYLQNLLHWALPVDRYSALKLNADLSY